MLKQRFGSGKFSAVDVAECCSAAASSGSSGASTVGDWAAVGTHGKHPGNMHRDLMRKLSKTCVLPPVYIANIPQWDHKNNEQCVVPTAFLLPHEMLAHMVREKGLPHYTDKPKPLLMHDWCSRTWNLSPAITTSM
jgi:hypothetical protein